MLCPVSSFKCQVWRLFIAMETITISNPRSCGITRTFTAGSCTLMGLGRCQQEGLCLCHSGQLKLSSAASIISSRMRMLLQRWRTICAACMKCSTCARTAQKPVSVASLVINSNNLMLGFSFCQCKIRNSNIIQSCIKTCRNNN